MYFISSVMQTHAQWLGIEWRLSTPYKPSTNGRIERRHADVGKILKLLDCSQEDWCRKLPYVAFEINSTVDKVTTMTPFEQFHGWAARIPHVLIDIPTATDTSNFLDWSNKVDKISWEKQLRQKQERMFSKIREQRDAHKNQLIVGQKMSSQLVPGDTV